jgi:hypothetical protein
MDSTSQPCLQSPENKKSINRTYLRRITSVLFNNGRVWDLKRNSAWKQWTYFSPHEYTKRNKRMTSSCRRTNTLLCNCFPTVLSLSDERKCLTLPDGFGTRFSVVYLHASRHSSPTFVKRKSGAFLTSPDRVIVSNNCSVQIMHAPYRTT